MAKVVLTTDVTLLSDYWQVPLLNFLGCAPVENFPESFFKFLSPSIPHENGIVKFAPYGLRKIEASLLKSYSREDVVVVHPNYIDDYIKNDTRIVGVSTMDPLGLGPVSMMFTHGGLFTAYTKKKFLELIDKINKVRKEKGYKVKVVVGGSGAWQLEIKEKERRDLNIDHLIVGEADSVADDLFIDIENGSAKEVIKPLFPKRLDDLPAIVEPSIQGIVEVMRGCGRNCEFCEPNLRIGRFASLERIAKEIKVNVKAGIKNAWIHSEDIFLYKVEDRRNLIPNRDALFELFSTVMSIDGIRHSNPTHGTVSPVVADPEMIAKISNILHAGPDKWIGIQPGFETASPRLIKKHMPYKAKPFSPEEWPEVLFEGTRILNENYWFPAYTLIIGLPGETDDDCWDTVRLIDKMEKELPEKIGNKAHFTTTALSFVPVGVLRNEEFFNVESMMTEARFAVIYRTWRHTLLEAKKASLTILHARNPIIRVSLWLLLKFGHDLIMRAIEKWGKSLGFEPEKALKVT
jgi:radical SAM superfamily enzyme YgiQ (UPF0313 family)